MHVFHLETGEHLMHVILSVCNVGEVPVFIPDWDVYAVALWPPPESFLEQLREANGNALKREEFAWNAIAGKKFRGAEGAAERVRPGEVQEFLASILIPMDVHAVRLETLVPHRLLRQQNDEVRAWTKYSIINLARVSREAP